MSTIRRMRAEDFTAVDPILIAAYGNPSSYVPRLERLLGLEGKGWFVALEDDRPVGMGGLTVTGRTAYVGLVAVDPTRQRRGIATDIMKRILEAAGEFGCETVLLDASESGRPLYEKLGFVADDMVGLWKRADGSPFPAEAASPEPGVAIATLAEENSVRLLPRAVLPEELASYDMAAWGDWRTKVLASFASDDPSLVALARSPDGKLRGYAMLQKASGILGPWISDDAVSARALLAWAMAHVRARVEIAYLPAANAEGARLLGASGFSLARSLTHMRLGKRLPEARRRLVWSQANFALG